MKTINYENGAVLTYDDTLTVGELIVTGCAPGYFVLIGIKFREEMMPLFQCAQVLDRDGFNLYTDPSDINAALGRPDFVCDASHCKRVTLEDVRRERDDAVQAANQRFNNIATFL
jgi:hypothetical protein